MIKTITFLLILFTFNYNVKANNFLEYNLNKKIYIGNQLNIVKNYNIKYEKQTNKINTYTNIKQILSSIYLGYKYNKNLNLEIGYNWLNNISIYKKFIKEKIETNGINLSAILKKNIYKNLNIYTKFGEIFINETITKNNNLTRKNIQKNIHNIYPLLNIGLEYKINKNIYSKLDYQIIYSKENKFKNTLININLIYKIDNINNLLKKITNIYFNKQNNIKQNNNLTRKNIQKNIHKKVKTKNKKQTYNNNFIIEKIIQKNIYNYNKSIKIQNISMKSNN